MSFGSVAAVALAGPYVEGDAGSDEAEGEEQGSVGRRQRERADGREQHDAKENEGQTGAFEENLHINS